MLRRITAMLLTTAIVATSFAGSLAKADTDSQISFEQTLIQKYSDIDR